MNISLLRYKPDAPSSCRSKNPNSASCDVIIFASYTAEVSEDTPYTCHLMVYGSFTYTSAISCPYMSAALLSAVYCTIRTIKKECAHKIVLTPLLGKAKMCYYYIFASSFRTALRLHFTFPCSSTPITFTSMISPTFTTSSVLLTRLRSSSEM